MRLAIIGSRSFTDYSRLCYVMDEWFDRNGQHDYVVKEVISGGANGADKLAARWAQEHNIKLTEFLADWEKHGKAAGFIRNEDIVREANVVLAFWDGESRGTQNSLSIAKRLKKPTFIVYT